MFIGLEKNEDIYYIFKKYDAEVNEVAPMAGSLIFNWDFISHVQLGNTINENDFQLKNKGHYVKPLTEGAMYIFIYLQNGFVHELYFKAEAVKEYEIFLMKVEQLHPDVIHVCHQSKKASTQRIVKPKNMYF